MSVESVSKESISFSEMPPPGAAYSRTPFWKLFLWAVGIRLVSVDSEYGLKLQKYRKYTALPITVMSTSLFLLIAVKIVLVLATLVHTFLLVDPEVAVGQHNLSTPVLEIIVSEIVSAFFATMSSIPWFFHWPLIAIWFLAFVVDFAVAATLAENKKRWWKTHWGGILAALFTIP